MKIQGLEVTAKLHEESVHFPFDKNDKNWHNHFKVTVKNGARRFTFDFYGSSNDHNKGVIELQDKDLSYALECALSDAAYAMSTFEDFCDELGYDQDSRRAERIYKICKGTLAKFERIGIDADKLHELREQVEEFEVEDAKT